MLIRIREQPRHGKPGTAGMENNKLNSAENGEERHRFGKTGDAGSPFLPEQK